jgi:hypothetical protein
MDKLDGEIQAEFRQRKQAGWETEELRTNSRVGAERGQEQRTAAGRGQYFITRE